MKRGTAGAAMAACADAAGKCPSTSGTQSSHMEQAALNSMSIDQLWRLHEEVAAKLAEKIAAEKVRLDARLREIQPQSRFSPGRARRPYPPVFPKYRNPKNPAETWSGRGKQPHWVRTQLEAGK